MFSYYSMVMGAAWSFGVRSSDRVYVSMPMYHTAAGIIGIGQMLLLGCSAVVRRRFSASNFWKDCVKHQCTVGDTKRLAKSSDNDNFIFVKIV
jgi:solute carrier family 27 fatty acid transporter 1/4